MVSVDSFLCFVFRRTRRVLPMQVDGEPWLQAPASVRSIFLIYEIRYYFWTKSKNFKYKRLINKLHQYKNVSANFLYSSFFSFSDHNLAQKPGTNAASPCCLKAYVPGHQLAFSQEENNPDGMSLVNLWCAWWRGDLVWRVVVFPLCCGKSDSVEFFTFLLQI